MVPETARPTPTPAPTPTPSTCGMEVVPETAHPTPTQFTSAIDVVLETDPRPTPTPSTSSGVRVIPETATSFASLNSSIISDTGNDKFLSNDIDSTLGGKKLTTSSFKRPSSPVKFTEKKSKNFDDFGDDDDEDLFNFDEPEPEVETSQRKRKRSDDDVNKEQQPSKKKNVKSPPPSPPLPPPPISVVKEEIPKSVKVVKKTNGFLSKSLFSNTALSTATSVKSDIPAEDMTRSFIKLELRSLVAKKPNSSINISANSPQENLSNGNVKNVKRFRKQIIAQTNSPVLCITNVSARTILEHFDDAPAQGNLLRGISIWSGAA